MVGGILPMVVIASLVLNRVFKEYREALLEGYSQSMEYAVSLIESKVEDYNELSKITYYYNSTNQAFPAFSFEDPFSITNILKDQEVDLEGTALETYKKNQLKIKKEEMNKFLRYAALIDQNVLRTYFLDRDGNLYGYFPNSFLRLDIDQDQVIPDMDLDTSYKSMIVYLTRINDYFHGQENMVITMGRNYFDVSGAVGQSKYMGTFYFDVDINAISSVFEFAKKT